MIELFKLSLIVTYNQTGIIMGLHKSVPIPRGIPSGGNVHQALFVVVASPITVWQIISAGISHVAVLVEPLSCCVHTPKQSTGCKAKCITFLCLRTTEIQYESKCCKLCWSSCWNSCLVGPVQQVTLIFLETRTLALNILHCIFLKCLILHSWHLYNINSSQMHIKPTICMSRYCFATITVSSGVSPGINPKDTATSGTEGGGMCTGVCVFYHHMMWWRSTTGRGTETSSLF